MPRFFFNIGNKKDREGTALESVAAAKCQAIKMAGTIVCEEADTFWDKAEWTMTVTDDTGLTQFQLCIVGIDAPIISAGQSARPTTQLYKSG